jgi:hypothetical protein
MQMLTIGADVNSYFSKQKLLLLRIKRYLIEIKSRYSEVLAKKEFNSNGLRLMVNKIKEMNMTEDELRDKINECIECIDFDIEQLDSDAEHVPLRLNGIVCSYELIWSIYTAAISIAFAALQTLFG